MNPKILKTHIELGERSYPIYLGKGIFEKFGEVFSLHKLPKRIAIISDNNVAELHLRQLTSNLRRRKYDVHEIIIPAGEKEKTLTRADYIFTKLLQFGFPRTATLIAFGGGVVGDLTGFVAAAFRRGVPYVQLPTTLLAQVESSLGGKTAVNHLLGKNAIGAYYQPKFVFSDVELLTTLPWREIICGLGEIVKYAMLDGKIFSFLNKDLERIMNYDLRAIQNLIALCNNYKRILIQNDECEIDPTGGRIVLNLGHTIGHALEHLTHHKLHHGEAVLIGLNIELSISKELGILNENDFQKYRALLKRIGFKFKHAMIDDNSLLNLIFGKENQPRFVLPASVGKVLITSDVEKALCRKILKKI